MQNEAKTSASGSSTSNVPVTDDAIRQCVIKNIDSAIQQHLPTISREIQTQIQTVVETTVPRFVGETLLNLAEGYGMVGSENASGTVTRSSPRSRLRAILRQSLEKQLGTSPNKTDVTNEQEAATLSEVIVKCFTFMHSIKSLLCYRLKTQMVTAWRRKN